MSEMRDDLEHLSCLPHMTNRDPGPGQGLRQICNGIGALPWTRRGPGQVISPLGTSTGTIYRRGSESGLRLRVTGRVEQCTADTWRELSEECLAVTMTTAIYPALPVGQAPVSMLLYHQVELSAVRRI